MSLPGTIGSGGLAASRPSLSATVWDWLENADLNLLGFVIAGMLVPAWGVGVSFRRVGRVEDRRC